jgi:hypothetical protein
MMKNFGRISLQAFLADRVVYRNLVPFDAGLPSLDDLRGQVNLAPPVIPRKIDPAYANVVVRQLAVARQLNRRKARLERLIFIGDTRLNDATAFDNLCRAGDWPGIAFIGSENVGPPSVDLVSSAAGFSLYLANRWSALSDFAAYCKGQDFPVDESTAVIVDMDKTAIGARGRNAQVIDQARVQAVYRTVSGFLGVYFEKSAFQAAYDQLNQVEFHPFTRDNQDYLAYVCLILGSGLFALEDIVASVRRGELGTFEGFIRQVDAQAGRLPPELREIHREIYRNVQAGDPTPFKSFRRQEYLETVGRMGQLPDSADVGTMLAEEIVITQEVYSLALEWAGRGALLFGLSDKPDEASLPTAEQAARGLQPIHRTVTHLVGAG